MCRRILFGNAPLPTAWTPATPPVAPFRDTRLDPSLRIPRWLALCGGAVLALGGIVAVARRAPAPVRVLRGILASSAAAYPITLLLDMAEHFRLEKALTGHRLRWAAVPLTESALQHLGGHDVDDALRAPNAPQTLASLGMERGRESPSPRIRAARGTHAS